ncbi:CapA family protein [Holophaga foetida]|uniref:CapA family protein n=1 Tax=Holophaga foetida TaxID=35839 RepID=UPI0002474CD4|nr:CapA family protein [Holophaga foetida]
MRRAVLFATGLFLALGCQRKAAPPPASPAAPVELRLVAVGDIMMHQDVKASAQDAPGGFPDLWRDLAPLFQKADLVFGNLETPVAPRSGGPGRPFLFNAPEVLVPALKQSGFHILATANNHAYDQGPKGLVETLERLRQQGLHALGSGMSRAEADSPCILERNGLRIGFLGATDVFNSRLNRQESGPWVSALDEDRLVETVRRLRPQVDALVLSLHWGNEYQHQPSQRQREIASRLVEAGADLILGHHPHVLQPLAWVEAGGRKGAVAYSLGNFISNQDRTYDPGSMPEQAGDSRDSVALMATWVKDGAGARLAEVKVEALWTENNWRKRSGDREIRVVRIGQQANSLARLRQQRIQATLDGRLHTDTFRMAAFRPKPRPKRRLAPVTVEAEPVAEPSVAVPPPPEPQP